MADEPKPQVTAMTFMNGEDGYYLKKRNALFEAVVKVSKNPEAPEIKESLTYHARKIPGPRFRSWLSFTKDVAAKNSGGSEAGLILLYNTATKEWQAMPPKQDLNMAHVDFGGVTEALIAFREKHGKNWVVGGTLHSHPGGAFASSTDEEDEKKMDGVHIIVPDFGKHESGIVAHVTASGSRFVVRKIDMLIDLKAEGVEEYPKDEWLKQVTFGNGNRYHRQDHDYSGRYGDYYGGHYGRGYHWSDSWDKENIDAILSVTTTDINGKESKDKKINVLSKNFDSLENLKALKVLGFSKKQRKFVNGKYEEDIRDMTIVFDYVRDVIKYITDVRGTLIISEKEAAVEKCLLALDGVMDCIKCFTERRIKNAGDMPEEVEADTEDDEKEEGVEETAHNEVKSVPGPTDEAGKTQTPVEEFET